MHSHNMTSIVNFKSQRHMIPVFPVQADPQTGNASSSRAEHTNNSLDLWYPAGYLPGWTGPAVHSMSVSREDLWREYACKLVCMEMECCWHAPCTGNPRYAYTQNNLKSALWPRPQPSLTGFAVYSMNC